MTVVHALGAYRATFVSASCAPRYSARLGSAGSVRALAFDPQRDVEVHVGLVAVDQRRELGERRQRVAAQGADGLAGVGEPGLDELAGAVDRVAQTRRGVFAVGELARPLQLDRGAGERVREHVVQLAGDPAALGDRRRAGLLIARVLELGQQQLGLVLALPRLLEELRDDAEQHRHQHPGRDSRRRSFRRSP